MMTARRRSPASATFLVLALAFVVIGLVGAEKTASSSSKNDKSLNQIFNQTINMVEQAGKSLRLRSVISLNKLDVNGGASNASSSHMPQKIFWSFKRIYLVPKFLQLTAAGASSSVQTAVELAQNELMISFDGEVHRQLNDKYSIDVAEHAGGSKYDLIINNLTFADAGLYKCDLWNQQVIYYKLVVLSPSSKPEIFIDKVLSPGHKLRADTFNFNAVEQSSVYSSAEGVMKLSRNSNEMADGLDYDQSYPYGRQQDYYDLNLARSSAPNSVASANRLIDEMSNVTIKCQSRHAYPYPTIKWFIDGKEIVIGHLMGSQVSTSSYLKDKKANMIESRLQITNVNSQFHLSNITCQVVQLQEEQESFDTLVPIASPKQKQQPLVLNSAVLTMNVAFKPVVNLDVIKINSSDVEHHLDKKDFQPLLVSSGSAVLNMEHATSASSAKISIYKESNVVFKCKFKANPIESAKIVWKINDVAVEQVDGAASETMSLAKLKANLGSETVKSVNLTCEVANSVGRGSFTYDIALLYEPKLIIGKSVYDIDEQSSLRLSCRVDASPAPSQIQWRRYSYVNTIGDEQSLGGLVSPSTTPSTTTKKRRQFSPSDDLYLDDGNSYMTIVSNSSLLDIKSIKHTEHAGFYVCIASNQMNDSFGVYKVGNQMAKMELNVRFKPKMNVISRKMAVNLIAVAVDSNSSNASNVSSAPLPRQKHNINCLTIANPQPVFNWFKNGVKLNTKVTNDDSVKYVTGNVVSRSKNVYENVLTINDLNESDINQKYECEAVNSLGSNRLEIELLPLSKPDRPSELRAPYVDFMTASIVWSPGFDGGLQQTFLIQVNDTLVELNEHGLVEVKPTSSKNNSSSSSSTGMRIIVVNANSINLTDLVYNSIYSVRIMSKNSLGSSEWSEYVHVKTSDLTPKDAALLPVFETLFLNVPKNMLEFTFKSSPRPHPDTTRVYTTFFSSLAPTGAAAPRPIEIPVCLRISGITESQPFDFGECAPIKTNELSFLNQFDLTEYLAERRLAFSFSPQEVKSIKVAICFSAKASICIKPASAIIDTYNTISHSSLISNLNAASITRNGNGQSDQSIQAQSISTIPVALIIGICVCILSLLILLFVSVIYCIRKRNFKLCKSLLTQKGNSPSSNTKSTSGSIVESVCDKTKPAMTPNIQFPPNGLPSAANVCSVSETERKNSHTNKSFNIDIASISAPMASSISINGNQLVTAPSNTGSHGYVSDINFVPSVGGVNYVNTINNGRRPFSAALTATATNLIKNKVNEILVTEDGDQQQLKILHSSMEKQSSSSASSASSTTTTSGGLSPNEQQNTSTGISNCSSSSTTMISNGANSNSNNSNGLMVNSSHQQLGFSHPTQYLYNEFNPFDVTDASNAASIIHKQEFTQQQIDLFKTATFIETYNASGTSASSSGSGSGIGSNSDPIAINNSLSSNSTTADSPTYGYNVAQSSSNILSIHKNHHHHHRHHHGNNKDDETIEEDNLLYVKTAINQQRHTTFPPLDESAGANGTNSYLTNTSAMLKQHQQSQQQQQRESSSAHGKTTTTTNGTAQFMEMPESGYSTPSRPKKVVYEVIV